MSEPALPKPTAETALGWHRLAQDPEALRALWESEQRYRSMFTNSTDAVAVFDRAGNLLEGNAVLERWSGYSLDELKGQGYQRLYVDPAQGPTLVPHLHESDALAAPLFELTYANPSGRRIHALVKMIPTHVDGETTGFIAVATDFSRQRRSEETLRFLAEAGAVLASSLDYRTTIAAAASLAVRFVADWCAVDVVEEDGTLARVAYAHADPAKVALLRELRSREPLQPDDPHHVVARVLRSGEAVILNDLPPGALRTDTDEATIRALGIRSVAAVPMRARDRTVGVMQLISAQPNHFDAAAIAVAEELASRAAMAMDNARLYSEAQRVGAQDPLTKLPNRTHFMELLGRAVSESAAQVGVLFLDLDGFKVINDSLGHQVGDRLLVAMAERLRSCVRTIDTVARLGGDEFTVLLESAWNVAEATYVAQRIVSQTQRPFVIAGHEIVVTPSIGVVVGNDTPAELLRCADVAMYESKRRGKACYTLFDATMSARVRSRRDRELDLRRAVERRELRVHYQPLVDLTAGHVVGVEALVRWQHPREGLLPPVEFIGLAEETGLILPLDLWVLAQACEQLVTWQAELGDAAPTFINVNLSARHFTNRSLARTVGEVLRETGLPPHALHIEITESIMVQDDESTHVTLRALRALGVDLVLDDFGTGYSSLSYLRRYPVTALKIDKSFVGGLGQKPEDEAIVRAMLACAQALGLAVSAEGIETPAQLTMLRSLGCGFGQGYLFSRPAAAADLTTLLAGRPRW